jgi:hypothetical protein
VHSPSNALDSYKGTQESMATIACIEETTALTTQTMITPTEAPTETGEAYQALKMPRASLPGAITPVKPQSSGIDSGYASQSSTPDSFEGGFSSHFVENGSVVKGARLWPSRKTVKLKHFVDKKIPQLTQSRFEDLRELHAGKLNMLTRGLPRCQGILMTLAVLGESEEKAAPWIFIQCDKRVAKKVRGFFAVPEVKLDFQPLHPVPYSPHFQIYVKELPPMMLGQVFPPEASPGPGTTQRMEMVDIYIAKGLDFDPYSSDTLCGTAIQTCPQGDHRTATLGGLIEVRNQDGSHDILGITAGHFLRQGSYDDADDSETLTDGSDDTFSDDGYEFDLDIDTTTNSEHGLEQERPATTIARTWQKLGIVYESSQDTVETARNLDWALIRIESPELYLPNAILGHKIVRSSPAYSNSAEAEAILSDKKVKLITGESGSRSGILSWSWSYLMLFPGDILTRAYSLTLSDNQGRHAMMVSNQADDSDSVADGRQRILGDRCV